MILMVYNDLQVPDANEVRPCEAEIVGPSSLADVSSPVDESAGVSELLSSGSQLTSSERPTAPVGQVGGPDVLHTISLRITALDMPGAQERHQSLRPSHCWLAYSFPGEPQVHFCPAVLLKSDSFDLLACVERLCVVTFDESWFGTNVD